MAQQPPASEGAPDKKKYAAFIKGIELLGIRLTSCKGEFVPENFADGGGRISYAVDVGFEDPRDSILEAIVTVRTRAKPTETKKMCTKVDCTYVLTYQYDTEPDEAILGAFARNVEINAWPYLREFIQNLTARMAGPTLMLPLRKQ